MLYSSTVLARSASSILTHLSRLPVELASHPLLFTLSTNTPPSSLSSLVSALSSFSSVGSVGCLATSPRLQVPAVSATSGGRVACSLAFFHREHATLFRSDIPGRPETQVGRWHAMRRSPKGRKERQGGEVELAEDVDVDVDWERIWSRSMKDNGVPPPLRKLGNKDVHTIITLTDNAPQGLNKSLSCFPLAVKLGLFCSSTPFVTGRPYTLLFNGSASSSGAVGFALSGGPRPALQRVFPSLRAITSPLEVTRSEGNLVNELDHRNPTAHLVSAIADSALSGQAAKEDEFYLGVLRDGEVCQVHHITSGGLSRESMALETETAPGKGTSVQLFHRPYNADASIIVPRGTKDTLTFVISPQSDSTLPAEEGGEAVTVLEESFIAASENGFMLGNEDETTWTCIAPGAQARLAW